MAIFIKLYRNAFGRVQHRGKWFAKSMKLQDTDLWVLAERIERNTTFKRGEVHGLLIELVEQVHASLLNGETVVIDGLGLFHLSVKSRHVDTPTDFRVGRDVEDVVCRFVPAGRRRSDGTICQRLAEGARVELWDDERSTQPHTTG